MTLHIAARRIAAGIVLLVSGTGLAQAAEDAGNVWITDPDSPELQGMMPHFEPDRSRYGCGPLREPGQTYHLSRRGADSADGLSWQTAWRDFGVAVSRLRAGDTLVIEEGTYVEPETMTIDHPVSGEPGKPITITAATGHRVILSGSEFLDLKKAEGLRNCYETTVDMELLSSALRETDTLVQLEAAGDTRRVEEFPATYTYEPETKRLVVHFSDSRGPDVHGLALRCGKTIGRSHNIIADRTIEIYSSYLRFSGIWFMFNRTSMVISGRPKDPNRERQLNTTYSGGEHITVEDCAFVATDFAGLVLTGSAAWNHIDGNYGAYGGSRCAISFLHPGENVHDNLIEKNLLAKAANKRRKPSAYAYSLNMYSKMGAWNLVLDNVLDDPHALRCKPQPPATVLQGNILTGRGAFFGVWRDPNAKGPFIFRNNTVLSPISYGKVQAGENRSGAREVYVNNFHASDRTARAKRVADAHFADLAYNDCRLQSDSPLRDKALGGGDIGAFRYPRGRVLFVGPSGDDAATGTALAQAWKSLAHAVAALRAGDTLYILPGTFSEPLRIVAAGSADDPVVVRAHGKKVVAVPSLELTGDWVRVEGLSVTGGVRVSGAHAELRHCLVHDHAGGPGVAVSASTCTLRHCTIVGNSVGVELAPQARDVRIRDSLIAFNQAACLKLPASPPTGLLISDTCWFGPGAESAATASGPRCRVADPLFADRSKYDYRPAWNSPDACLGAFATTAGAFQAVRRQPMIENAAVVNLRANSAVIRWTTTELETAGYVAYRKTGSDTWSRPRVPTSGTRHAVQLTDLKPAQTYEYIIVSTNHWNGEMAQSQPAQFATPMASRPGKTFHVSTAGSNAADGLTPDTAWCTFNRAFRDVGPGDTILVAPGHYHETLLPIAGGAEGQTVVVRGQGDVVVDCMDVTGPYLIARDLHHVEFRNITFDRIPTYGNFMGIMIQIALRDCSNIRFLNCRVNKTHGVPRSQTFVLNNSREITLDHVVCWSGETLIVAHSCDNLVIRNCTFVAGTVWGMRFAGKIGRVSLVNNIIYNPAWNPNALFYMQQSKPDLSFLTSDYNCFVMDCYGDDKKLRYAGVGSHPKFMLECRTLQEWREKSGQDAHSIEISRKDPLFHNPREGDFRLHAKSLAMGAARDGANLGALGIFPLYFSGKRNYNVGEARTVRLQAEMHGGIPPNTEFEWTVPYSEKKRRGRTLEYTPIDVRVGGTIILRRVGHKGEVAIHTTVPTKEMSEPKTFALLETEDRVAEGGGKVMEHTDWLQSGRAAISHWNKAGHWLEWEFEVPAASAYEFHLKFARNRAGVATRTFLIDGKCPAPEYEKLTFRNVWTWGNPWHYQKLGPPITLTKGKHRLRMGNPDGTSLNTDCFVIVPKGRK